MLTLGSNNVYVLLDFERRTLWCKIMSVLLPIYDAWGKKYVRPRTLGSEKMYVLSDFLCVKDALLCVFGNTEFINSTPLFKKKMRTYLLDVH